MRLNRIELRSSCRGGRGEGGGGGSHREGHYINEGSCSSFGSYILPGHRAHRGTSPTHRRGTSWLTNVVSVLKARRCHALLVLLSPYVLFSRCAGHQASLDLAWSPASRLVLSGKEDISLRIGEHITCYMSFCCEGPCVTPHFLNPRASNVLRSKRQRPELRQLGRSKPDGLR